MYTPKRSTLNLWPGGSFRNLSVSVMQYAKFSGETKSSATFIQQRMFFTI